MIGSSDFRTANEAFQAGNHSYATVLISSEIERAKWRALRDNICDAYKVVFPNQDIPDVPQHSCEDIYLADQVYELLLRIHKSRPDIAAAIVVAAEDHDIFLGEHLILNRRKDLFVVDDEGASQMPPDPSGPVPE